MNFYNPYQNQQGYTPPIPDQLSQYRQPYMYPNQAVQPPQQQSAMVWVRSRAEAEAYPVAPNTAIALWDMNEPLVYKKETDVSGKPMTKAFKLVEVTENVQSANSSLLEFATREELKAVADSVADLAAKMEVANNG